MGRLPADLEDRGQELDRLKALSDGVFAIVLTLLVLELRVPTLEKPATSEELLRALGPMAPKLIAYVLTFGVVGLYWIIHTRVIRHINAYDRGILFLNLVFLMFVSVLPFTSALVGEYPELWASFTLYAGNMALAGVFSTSLWQSAVRKGYVGQEVTPTMASFIRLRGLVIPIVFALAAGVSVINPRAALLAPALIPLALKLIQLRYQVQD